MTRSRDQKCSHINYINIQNNQERHGDLKYFFGLDMYVGPYLAYCLIARLFFYILNLLSTLCLLTERKR